MYSKNTTILKRKKNVLFEKYTNRNTKLNKHHINHYECAMYLPTSPNEFEQSIMINMKNIMKIFFELKKRK